jgi:tRNA(adenine34) deaminase
MGRSHRVGPDPVMDISSQLRADDLKWMHRAIELARQGAADPKGGPIGCVITRGGKVIGEGYNEAELRRDPTAHAEIVAMRRAGRNLQCSEFRDATLYTTLQPCGMCSMAVIWAKIGRIVHGAGHGEVHKMYFEEKHLDTIDYINDAYRDDRLTVIDGLLAEECAILYVSPGTKVPTEQQFNR